MWEEGKEKGKEKCGGKGLIGERAKGEESVEDVRKEKFERKKSEDEGKCGRK